MRNTRIKSTKSKTANTSADIIVFCQAKLRCMLVLFYFLFMLAYGEIVVFFYVAVAAFALVHRKLEINKYIKCHQPKIATNNGRSKKE